MCDAYHSSKIVVVPSQYLDPLPTTVLEGMACGKPVIGSAAGGILEMILSHVTGELIEPKDIDGFAKATIKLLLDTELQREYGDRGYERITQIFSIEKKMQVYEAYYREKVSGTL
jgi:glycosyltransferase involved in cell wall biosynthesis